MKKQSLLFIVLAAFLHAFAITMIAALVWVGVSELILSYIFEGYTAFAHISTPEGQHNLKLIQASPTTPTILSLSLVLCILWAVYQTYFVYLPRIIRGAAQ